MPYALFLLLLLVCISSKSQTQLAIFVSDFNYEERENSHFIMAEDATILGVSVAMSGKTNTLHYHLDTSLQYGEMDYSSANTGSMSGYNNSIFNVHGVIGKSIPLHSQRTLVPYVGLGYRLLISDAEGKRTSTGHYGYFREQAYWYIPLGVTLENTVILADWRISATLEYDFLLRGNNSTDLTSIGGPALSFKQRDGYGAQAELAFQHGAITLAPFIKYWSIAASDTATAIFNNNPVVFVEPENTSIEYGLAIQLDLTR